MAQIGLSETDSEGSIPKCGDSVLLKAVSAAHTSGRRTTKSSAISKHYQRSSTHDFDNPADYPLHAVKMKYIHSQQELKIPAGGTTYSSQFRAHEKRQSSWRSSFELGTHVATLGGGITRMKIG